MSNERKTWEILSAVPDPFAAGILYVTQRQTNGGSIPETRVMRCRLYPNSRLENVDVAPQDINDTHKVTVSPPTQRDISTIAKLVSRELAFHTPDEQKKREHWDQIHFAMGGEDELVSTVPSLMETSPSAGYIAPKKSDLYFRSDFPLYADDVAGVITEWLTRPGIHIAVAGTQRSSYIAHRLGMSDSDQYAFGRAERYWKSTSDTLVFPGENPGDPDSTIQFFGPYIADSDKMRGRNFHFFVIQEELLERIQRYEILDVAKAGKMSTELNHLENLHMGTRLGDRPMGIVLAADTSKPM